MPQTGQMHPQLMGTSGMGKEADQGRVFFSAHGLIQGQGRLACPEADLLPRPVGPVPDKGQIDAPPVFGHRSFHQSQIDLAGPSVLKLPPQNSFGLAMKGHGQHPRSAQIQPVYSLGSGMALPEPGQGRI